MPKQATTYRAAWLFPVDQPPIENGFVTVAEGIIRAVGRLSGSAKNEIASEVVDVGDVALIPALVNAHTHFEFSHLKKPLGHFGIEFTGWIQEIVASRRTTSSTIEDKRRSIRLGIAESINCGVGCVGEIATVPVCLDDYRSFSSEEMPIGVTVCREALGLNALAVQEKETELKEFLNEASELTPEDWLSAGLSPHAPYSVHSNLQKTINRLALQTQSLVAMHLAETKAERELLDSRTGPFVQLLQDFGIWNENCFNSFLGISDSLSLLSQCYKALVVHGNYLSDEELQFIADHRQTMSMVFCPRTHAYFDHEPYPLRRIMELGVPLALGTDSRGSSPDLNLLDELLLIRKKYADLDTRKILEMGTIVGAVALGRDHALGSLTVGKRALISAIGLKTGMSDPSDLLDEAVWCRRVC